MRAAHVSALRVLTRLCEIPTREVIAQEQPLPNMRQELSQWATWRQDEHGLCDDLLGTGEHRTINLYELYFMP